jgi:hypothetical protein
MSSASQRPCCPPPPPPPPPPGGGGGGGRPPPPPPPPKSQPPPPPPGPSHLVLFRPSQTQPALPRSLNLYPSPSPRIESPAQEAHQSEQLAAQLIEYGGKSGVGAEGGPRVDVWWCSGRIFLEAEGRGQAEERATGLHVDGECNVLGRDGQPRCIWRSPARRCEHEACVRRIVDPGYGRAAAVPARILGVPEAVGGGVSAW